MDISKLTKDALKNGNPSLFLEIEKEAKKSESKRVAQISKYAIYDKEKADSIIKSGENLTIDDVEYFMEKKAGLEKVANLEEVSADDFVAARQVVPAPSEKLTDEQKKQAEKKASLEEIRNDLGVNTFIEKLEK